MTVDASNMLNLSSKLLEISKNFRNLSSVDVTFATATLEKFVGLVGRSKEVESNIMDSIDHVMSANKTSLMESEMRNNTTTRYDVLLAQGNPAGVS